MTEMSAAPVDAVLRAAVREIEAHAAEGGWDQPARLYALVPTSDLLAFTMHLADPTSSALASALRQFPTLGPI